MKDIWLKRLGAAALAIGLVAPVSAHAQFGEWDADSDGIVSEEEFGAGFGEAGVYGGWDANADGVVDEAEFGAGFYRFYNRDDAEGLTEEEFGGYEEDEEFFGDD